MLTKMILHGLMAAMIVAGGAFLYAASAQPPHAHMEASR